MVLISLTPPLDPTRLLPLRSSISASATSSVVVLSTVLVPVTVRSPPIVTVEPSSEIILLVNWSLEPSHFITLFACRLAAFFRLNWSLLSVRPPVVFAL